MSTAVRREVFGKAKADDQQFQRYFIAADEDRYNPSPGNKAGGVATWRMRLRADHGRDRYATRWAEGPEYSMAPGNDLVSATARAARI